MQRIKRVLISVSDKTGLLEFATKLQASRIEIIATGGTSRVLKDAGIPVISVEDITQFPEIMAGRVKTLHPKIHGGILGKREAHKDVAAQYGITWIDLVIVNLYPFAQTVKQPNTSFEAAIEQIDIGGPAMIRSAAKNMAEVAVVIDPTDYTMIAETIETNGGLDFSQRKVLAQKAFQHTADYDQHIYKYLVESEEPNHLFPKKQQINLQLHSTLRYGENPHQSACLYESNVTNGGGILDAHLFQGKTLSYNNLVDSDAAYQAVHEFEKPCCVIVKHANPCGIATSETIEQAFSKAFESDSVSAFGGVVAFNQICDESTAKRLTEIFFEVIIAPDYSEQALSCFASKKNLRVLRWPYRTKQVPNVHFQFLNGAVLAQEQDCLKITQNQLQSVTTALPDEQDIENLLFAWRAVKQVKSNAIVIACDQQTTGIGIGQVSRVDAVIEALRKAGNRAKGGYLASDAFFPFKDSIELIANAGIKAIIQPGGSIRDQEVIEACNLAGIRMVFTHHRCFKH